MKNKLAEIFFMILGAFIFFIATSFYKGELSIGNYSLKKINLLEDITIKNLSVNSSVAGEAVFGSIPSNDSAHTIAGNENHLNNDSLYRKDSTYAAAKDALRCANDPLAKFFESFNLTKSKRKKTRIGHWGDSIIGGDLITEELRKILQEKFGGYGVGFVPIAYNDYDRGSITNSSSSNWSKYTLKDSLSEKHPLGISGFVYEPSYVASVDPANLKNAGGSWVQYDAVERPGLDGFYDVKLFYGPGKSNDYIYYNGKSKQLNGTETVNQLVLNEKSPLQNINVSFVCQSPIKIYGFSFESPNGVFVDNFGIGSTWGTELAKIPEKVLKGFDQYFDYSLVMLEYGPNVVEHTPISEYPLYEKKMIAVINRFKTCFPNASVLVISTADYWKEQRGQNLPHPAVHGIVELQRKIAEKTNSAFWNLYEEMGGDNSMDSWVKAGLARLDYNHFNSEGAKKVSGMLYKFLNEKYSEYNQKKVKAEVSAKKTKV